MHKRILFISLGLALYSLSALVQAADIWTVRSTQLRNSPSFTSKKVLPVKKGDQLQQLKRKGGWVQVQLGSKKGWLRSYEVRNSKVNFTSSSASKKPGLSGTIAGLSRSTSSLFGTKASQTTQKSVVATLGVRGLSEDQLKKAKPNYSLLDSLNQWQSNQQQAKKLADGGALKAARIQYIRTKK